MRENEYERIRKKVMRFMMEVAEKPSMAERVEMIKSPRFFRHMQYPQFFIHYHCDNCTRYCPGTS